jgi:hypothetical protein
MGKKRRLVVPALLTVCMSTPLVGGPAGASSGTQGVGNALRQVAGQTAAATAQPDMKVIAEGLNNPRGIDIGPHGAVFVAEAGKGGSGPCVPGPEGDTCFGLTGAVTKVWRGQQRRVLRRLPSLASEDGSAAFGTHDVSLRKPGRLFATVGLAGNLEKRRTFLPEGRALGHIVRKVDHRPWHIGAFLTRYETIANPDGGEVDSDPYSIIALKGRRIATDAGGNDLLRINHHGISTIATFPDRMVDFNGEQVPMQAVPTGVVKGPDGALYVGQLTGFPFPVGKARVYRVVPGHKPQIYARGFTNIIDVAFGPHGRLYVLEITKNGLLSGDPTGALIRVNRDGSHTTVASEGLIAPGGLAIGPHGRTLVSNCGVCPGTGQVVRISH